MPAGRPTKFKPEYIDKLKKWFTQKPFNTIKGKRIPKELPTIINFARSIKVGHSTVYDWLDPKHASFKVEFSDTFKKIVKESQKECLMQNGLAGLWNPIFAKFIATNLTELKDKKDVELTDNTAIQAILESLPVEMRNQVAESVKEKLKKS